MPLNKMQHYCTVGSNVEVVVEVKTNFLMINHHSYTEIIPLWEYSSDFPCQPGLQSNSVCVSF